MLSARGCWYLVFTKPAQERVARLNLERQGYEVYLPLTQERKRRRSGVVFFSKNPMFPRYLFVCLATGLDNFSPIRSTRGVVDLVRFSGLPASVPPNLIDSLQAVERVQLESSSLNIPLKPGDRVRIMEGPLFGYEGVFHSVCSGGARVRVLLDLLSSHAALKVPRDSLDCVEGF